MIAQKFSPGVLLILYQFDVTLPQTVENLANLFVSSATFVMQLLI